MPKNGIVFLVEDDQYLRRVEKLWVESENNKVVLEASSLAEALEKVKSAKEEGVNVGVIDGSLDSGPTNGPQVAEALKRAVPGVKIISFSGEQVEWGDENPTKPDNITKLGKIVAKLL